MRRRSPRRREIDTLIFFISAALMQSRSITSWTFGQKWMKAEQNTHAQPVWSCAFGFVTGRKRTLWVSDLLSFYYFNSPNLGVQSHCKPWDYLAAFLLSQAELSGRDTQHLMWHHCAAADGGLGPWVKTSPFTAISVGNVTMTCWVKAR